MTTKLILLGAGKIGHAILSLLSHVGNYEITVADQDQKRLNYINKLKLPNTQCIQSNLSDINTVAELIRGHEVTISATPYFLTSTIATAAKKAHSHYFDLTEDVSSTRTVKQLAQGAKTVFVPQCGLAPGFISIVTHDLASRFDTVRDMHMRVGALPVYPNNALKYNLTWSTDGLINEYCNPCEAIVNKQVHEVPPLEDLETLLIDGVEYEAFTTSGGLGTLYDSWKNKVDTLNYKTIRYPGHRNLIKFLIHDLQLGQQENRSTLKELLENAIPSTQQDVAIIFVSVCGQRNGRLEQETYISKIYGEVVNHQALSAIQLTTATSVCAMVDMFVHGQLPQSGLIRQEQVPLKNFLENRFGQRFQSEVRHA